MSAIETESLSEHREIVLSALMDGAEKILLGGDEAKLTAAAVAAEAGIARNSIYRYVSSIDDLVDLVLARAFDEWAATVAAEVAAAPTPRDGVVAYVRSNLTLAANGDHALQQTLSRRGLSESSRARVIALHEKIEAVLHGAVAELAPTDADLVDSTILALVDATFRYIVPGQPANRVIDFACRSAAAILDVN